ncbi:hypothetical protein [Planktothrix sp. FACHB-1365]|uniref:hypothetical protein n=1 Tax=Planktothrix sp. FACHB-1365 TaxID=2692855 RepID=UPI0016888560|nr:hypothetical protein [Planktothrix sp. FACHB-1365]MBD2485864.1 hypothetical protein [Planktothrix sp. FACHB-1365]
MQWKPVTVLLLTSILFMQHSLAIAQTSSQKNNASQTSQCKDTDGRIIPCPH